MFCAGRNVLWTQKHPRQLGIISFEGAQVEQARKVKIMVWRQSAQQGPNPARVWSKACWKATALWGRGSAEAKALTGRVCMWQGKKRKDTVCIVLADDSVEEAKIRINKVVRKNLRVRLGDIVSVHQARPAAHGRLGLLLRESRVSQLNKSVNRVQTCTQGSGWGKSRQYGSSVAAAREAGKVCW